MMEPVEPGLGAELTAAAFEFAPFGVAVLDLERQRWLVTNRALADMLGYRRDELAGMSVAAITHPDDRDAIDPERAVLRQGSLSVTKRYVRRDGTILWARVTGRHIAGSEPATVIVHIEDVTDRTVAEERARQVLASLHEGITVHDASGATIEWNPAMLEMSGLDADQLRGARALPEGWHVVDADGAPLPRDRHPDVLVMADGRPRLNVIVGVVCPGRPLRWFRTSAVRLGDGSGVITTFAEETERIEADRTIQLARDRFAALVEQSRDLITVLIPGSDGYDYASPAWNRLLGWDPGDLDLAGLGERIHPEDYDGLVNVMLDVMAKPGDIRHLVFRVRHADGSWRHLDTTITNLVENPAVGGIVLNSSDVTQQIEAEAELRQQALHDGLTGLPNRRLVLDRIGQAVEEQRREGTTVAVLFLDLDDFKSVNDAHGHAAGDELLVAVAGRITGAVRAVDTVGRMGGDEFVVVASLKELGGATSVARHIEDALRDPIALSGGLIVSTRASIGVVVARADLPKTPEELLGEADTAMYEVKRRRRHLRAVN